MNKVPNVQVSDTTGDEYSSTSTLPKARQQKIKKYKYNFTYN